MFKTRFISMLVLLAAVATGARAQWTGGTYTATANENLGAITVNGDATLTINSDVTVTVTGGINVASGTLTVTGPGTLVVTGSTGSNGTGVGSVDTEGGTGGTGGVAISGNIIVQGGATVTATGGTGGTGATGGWYGGNGGNGGNAFAGTLTYKSGTVTANGGSGGSGAQSSDWDPYKPSSGSAGKAFANDVDFTQTTGYSVTNGTSTIGSVLNQTKVVISGGTPIPTGYSVSLKSVTEDASSWQGKAGEGDYQELPLEGLEAGTAVSVKYSGTKKVKSVKAKKAAPATVPVTAITLNKTATTIQAGQTETLSVSSVTPDDATDQTVTWSSDNEAVATVDADGKVTAVAFGTANITATANDGSGVTATCVVTVNKVVTINQSDWGWSSSFTKDGVTVSASRIDPNYGDLMSPGTFSTTLGNFTKIVVTTFDCSASGTGWSGSGSSMTWAGTPASTVSFSGEFTGMGQTQTTIVCTIVPKN